MTKVMFNGIEMDAEQVQIEIDHGIQEHPVAHLDDIVNTGMEITANVKLTRYGRRFMRRMHEMAGEAAQAGFMIVNKGRGRYGLQRFPYGKRGNKRNIYPYGNRRK